MKIPEQVSLILEGAALYAKWLELNRYQDTELGRQLAKQALDKYSTWRNMQHEEYIIKAATSMNIICKEFTI